MTARKELNWAQRVRYRDAAVAEKAKILDEFVALTGYHRKHASAVEVWIEGEAGGWEVFDSQGPRVGSRYGLVLSE